MLGGLRQGGVGVGGGAHSHAKLMMFGMTGFVTIQLRRLQLSDVQSLDTQHFCFWLLKVAFAMRRSLFVL